MIAQKQIVFLERYGKDKKKKKENDEKLKKPSNQNKGEKEVIRGKSVSEARGK